MEDNSKKRVTQMLSKENNDGNDTTSCNDLVGQRVITNLHRVSKVFKSFEILNA